jgi:hypothetical protein
MDMHILVRMLGYWNYPEIVVEKRCAFDGARL